jgi:hypothetical protein
MNCHNRQFIGWTDRVGQNVAWSVCGWTVRQGTVHVHVYVHVSMCMCMCMSISIFIFMSISMFMSMYMQVQGHGPCSCPCLFPCLCSCNNLYIHIHVHVHVHFYARNHVEPVFLPEFRGILPKEFRGILLKYKLIPKKFQLPRNSRNLLPWTPCSLIHISTRTASNSPKYLK